MPFFQQKISNSNIKSIQVASQDAFFSPNKRFSKAFKSIYSFNKRASWCQKKASQHFDHSFQKQQLRKIKSIQVTDQDAFFSLNKRFSKASKSIYWFNKRASWCQTRWFSPLLVDVFHFSNLIFKIQSNNDFDFQKVFIHDNPFHQLWASWVAVSRQPMGTE